MESIALDTASSLSSQSAKLDSLGDQVTIAFTNVSEKLDLMSSHVMEKVSSVDDRVKKVEIKLDVEGGRLSSLEGTTRGSENLKRNFKRLLFPLLVAAGSSIISIVIEHIKFH